MISDYLLFVVLLRIEVASVFFCVSIVDLKKFQQLFFEDRFSTCFELRCIEDVCFGNWYLLDTLGTKVREDV